MCATHARRALNRARDRARDAAEQRRATTRQSRQAQEALDAVRARLGEAGLPTTADAAGGENLGGTDVSALGEQTRAAMARAALTGVEDAAAHACRAADTARQAHEDALEALAAAQMDYDATPEGIAALRAVVGAAPTPQDRAHALARLVRAKAAAERTLRAWEVSSARTEQRILRARTEQTRDGLRRELVERRCREHATLPPPVDARAHPAWLATPDGATWAALHEQVGDSADLTFMLPAVRAASDAADRVAAHWGNVPAPWVPDTTEARFALARHTGTPWTPTPAGLAAAVAADGQEAIALRGRFAGGGNSDTWQVAAITGPFTPPGATETVTDGWVCVRDRDSEVRVLPDLTRFRAP